MTAIPLERTDVAALVAELLSRPESVTRAALDALTDHDVPDTLDHGVWGLAPATEEVVGAAVRNEERIAATRSALLDDALTRSEAAERIGVSPQQISRLVADGDLVVIRVGRSQRLPAWQFRLDTAQGRLPGIREVVSAFPGGPLSLSGWMIRPNPALGNRTPVQAVTEGDLATAVAVAEARV